MGYSFRLAARVLLYADRITYTTAFVTPVVEHWLELEIALWYRTRDVKDVLLVDYISDIGNVICQTLRGQVNSVII